MLLVAIFSKIICIGKYSNPFKIFCKMIKDDIEDTGKAWEWYRKSRNGIL